MARRSRKKVDITENRSSHCKEKIYSAALYARISVETERKREADTIGNQLQLLKNYVSEQMDIKVFDAYIDDILIYETVKKPVVPPVHYMFIKGVSDGIITSDAVTMVFNNTKVGEFVAVAQFDNKDGLLGVKYILSETAGLNELSLDIEDDTEYVIVFVWENLSTLKPLINEYTLSVE